MCVTRYTEHYSIPPRIKTRQRRNNKYVRIHVNDGENKHSELWIPGFKTSKIQYTPN
jgi:hypothetical protein